MGDVETYNSAGDPNPFNPNAPADQGSQQTALPGDLSLPELSMAWTSLPEFQLVPPPAGGGAGSSYTTVSGDVTVDLGGVRDSADTMLLSSMRIVQVYEDLKALFLADKDWVYGQEATTSTMETGGYYQGATAGTMADPIQSQAIAFANGSSGSPGMNAIQEYALQSIGNAMGTLGELIAALNAAGGMYAQADVWSTFPPAS